MYRFALILGVLFQISRGFLFPNMNRSIWLQNLEDRSHHPIPESVDWAERGMVSRVKDQGVCEACWAFAIIATIESLVRIQFEQENILSEQFLIDCLPSSKLCEPMPLVKAYADLVANLGVILTDYEYYPYVAHQEQCRWRHIKALRPIPPPYSTDSVRQAPQRVMAIGLQRVKSDEDVMARWIAEYGPITAAINPARMYDYHKRYIDEPTDNECDPLELNHTVSIVGYGVSESNGRRVKYWTIKNSWGENWGAEGYYYLVRGRNACGIANDVVVPYVTTIDV